MNKGESCNLKFYLLKGFHSTKMESFDRIAYFVNAFVLLYIGV
jgi:hypothetical protein